MNPNKKFVGILAGMAAFPLAIITYWGIDVYSANVENKQRIRSAIELKLGSKFDYFKRNFNEACPNDNRASFSLWSGDQKNGDVCIEFINLGCRTIDYLECPHSYGVVSIDKIVQD